MKKELISKARFFLITCILIPAAFLLLFEFTLRIADYGYPSGFFVKETINGQEFYVNNYKFSWRFFPKAMARLSASVVVPVKKDKDAMRIFVFGESAAQGDPEPSFSFSRMLQAVLEKKYPDKKIEIYNTAITAINSNVIVPIVNDCLALEPDLFIVYMGNNEVIGPYGLSSSLTPFFSNHNTIKFQVWLGQTKIGQLIRALSAKKDIDQQEWGGMELFMKNQVRHSTSELEKIYSHFDNNINDICNAASKAGVKVILSTVITNERDCAPFLSPNDMPNNAQLTLWKQFYNTGIQYDSAQQYSQALEQYGKALALNPEYAELNFRIAKCYLSLNQQQKAKAFFTKARDYDALRFRADSRINQIIKNTASLYDNVSLVDSKVLADEKSDFGIAGNDLLYEHVHLNVKGNYTLASGILPYMEKALSLQRSSPIVSLSDCQTRLAYTLFDEQNIEESNLSRLQSAPFTNQYSNKFDVKLLKDKIKNIESGFDSLSINKMRDVYDNVVSTYPADWPPHLNYLKFLIFIKSYSDAAKQAESLCNLLPYEYFSLVNMGVTRQKLKRFDEALKYYEAAIKVNPYFSEVHKNLASLYEDQGLYYKVPYHLLKAHKGTGEMAVFYNQAGMSFARKNRMDSAITYFTKAVTIAPNFIKARQNLNRATDLKNRKIEPNKATVIAKIYNDANNMFQHGEYENAILKYQDAIRLNPSFAKAYNNAAIAFIQLKKFNDALQYFTDAIRVDPYFMEAYPNIAMLLSNQGRHNEAIDVLKKALKLRADPQLYHMMGEEYLKIGNKAEADKCLGQEQAMLQLRPKR